LLAFDGKVAGVAQARVREHVAQRGGAVRPEREHGDAELAGGAQRGVALPVDHRARDVVAAPPPQQQQRREGLPEGRLAGGVQGQQLREDVGVRGGGLVSERLVDGDEGELRVARGVRSVEVRVEDGDSEAMSVEDRRELEHGVQVALEWQGEEDDLAAVGAAVAMLFLSGHCRRQSDGS